MRNAIKLAASVGSAAVILASGSALAQDVAVPDFNLGFGVIDINTADGSCGNGQTCTTIAGAAGTDFIQRQIDGTDGAGNPVSYIQTIINDPAGGFATEDYVQVVIGGQGSQQGLASRMSISEGDPAAPTFATTSTIRAGWGNTDPNGTANAVIDLAITDPGTGNNDSFNVTFQVDTTFDQANGTNVLNGLIAEQTAELGAAGDVQRFYTQIKAADGSVAASTGSDPYTIPGGLNSVTWAAGDMIQVVWVGQDMAATGPFGSQTVSQVDADGNAVTSTTFSSISPAEAPGPWDWITPEFGTAPTF